MIQGNTSVSSFNGWSVLSGGNGIHLNRHYKIIQLHDALVSNLLSKDPFKILVLRKAAHV